MSVYKRDEGVVYGDNPTTRHIRELTLLADWLRERTPSDDPGLLALDWARQQLGDPAKFFGTKTLQDRTTYQWLIERAQPEGLTQPVWLEHSALYPARDKHWTSLAFQAAMFPTRESAEEWIAEHSLPARAVEHGFMPRATERDAEELRARRADEDFRWGT